MKYLIEGVTKNEYDYSKVLTVKRVVDEMGIVKFTTGHYFQDCDYCPSLYSKTGKRVAKYVTLTEQ